MKHSRGMSIQALGAQLLADILSCVIFALREASSARMIECCVKVCSALDIHDVLYSLIVEGEFRFELL